MSLSSASQLQNFFEKQKKAGLKKERFADASKSLESENSAQRILLQNPRRKETEESAQRFSAKTPKRIESEELMQKEESHSLKKIGGSQESNRRKEPAGSSFSVSQTGAVSSFAFGEIREEKERALSRSQKLDLIERAEGRSSRETEKLLLERLPENERSVARREKTRILGNGQVEIKAIVSESCHKKLKELKNLLSHRNPSMGYGGLLEILSDLALDKYDPRRKGQARKNPAKNRQTLNSGERCERGGGGADSGVRAGGRNENRKASLAEASGGPGASSSKPESRFFVASAQKSGQTSRYIPAEVKRRVWARDKGRCSYMNPQSGRKCESRRFLHIDHILPFALGGKTTTDNLRLLCAGHNQFRARQTFKSASICKKNF